MTWADGFAAVALDNLSRRYPYEAHHQTSGDDDRALPIELHPAFATSYDWHSSVHMHWLSARLLAFGVDEDLEAVLGVGVPRDVRYLPAGAMGGQTSTGGRTGRVVAGVPDQGRPVAPPPARHPRRATCRQGVVGRV